MTTTRTEIFSLLHKNIKHISITHLAYVIIGTVIFAPLTGLASQLLIRLSGKTVLSDFEIAAFLLSPVGLVALTLFTALLITILVFEQASLMAISAGALQQQTVTTFAALHFTFKNIAKIFTFAVRLVIRILLRTLPFLAVSALIAKKFLTEYDINYYLTAKPPVFLVTAAVIAVILTVMIIFLLRRLFSWSLALPVLLFDDISPAASFKTSANLLAAKKQLLFIQLVTWAITAFFLSAVILGGIQLLGSYLAPLFFNSITMLVPVLGALVALLAISNFLITTFTSGSFAALLVVFYQRTGSSFTTLSTPELKEESTSKVSIPLFATLLVVACLAAVLTGVWLLNGIQPDRDIQIIAHRGAAGKAPENTMASITQAIADKTDWVEIDVQETVDDKILVIHDSDFMKLAQVDLKVWDASYQRTGQIDIGSWFEKRFSNERAPLLSQVLNAAHSKTKVLIELKYYGHDKVLEQRVADTVESTDMVENVAVMSLQYDGIKKFKSLRPDWETGLLVTKTIGRISSIDVDFLAMNMAAANASFIHRVQSLGKKVYVWTVNDAASMARMMALGVDGIITDEPELAHRVRSRFIKLTTLERLVLHTTVFLNQPVPLKHYRDKSP